MANYQALADELNNDPEGRDYAAMSDAAAAVDLNTAYRTRDKATMTASEILQAINIPEFNGKTEAQQGLIWNLLHMGVLNPFGVEATLFASVFNADPSPTITALIAARKTAITRAAELGLGVVKEGYVAKARAL